MKLLRPISLPACATSILLFVLSGTTAAQCNDPVPPPGGFGLTSLSGQNVTYADGAVTRMTVRYPSIAPGSCGWPVVILVHGTGGTKFEMSGLANFLSAQGYFTAAYDVRGQGYAATANPTSLGTEFSGKSEILDLAEIVSYIQSTYPGLADTTRLGISGFSQGGIHSWLGAAYSGKALPPNGRGIATFPVFKAAYPVVAATDIVDYSIPQGNAVAVITANIVLRPPSAALEIEPTLQNTLASLMSTEDYAGMTAFLGNDPWRQICANLADSQVPVMMHIGWNDVFFPVELAIRALDAMPASTATRALLSPVGFHQEPSNQKQIDLSQYSAQRWFDRFLKGIPNQVDIEPRFISAVVPDSDSEYRNASTLLWNRYSATWPPPDTTMSSYFLRQGGSLDNNPPTTAEPADTVQHVVAPAASMAAFVSLGAAPSQITAWCALDSKNYDTAVLADPVEIAGSPRAVLEVTPSGPNYQLHCALYQVDPAGTERYLQTGVALVRGNPGTQQLVVDFLDIRALVPAGDRLRLKIENLTRRFPAGLPAGQFNYYTVPYFENVDVAIEHSAARPSWFEIPTVNVIRPALASATTFYDTLNPSDVTFTLESTPLLAGQPYFMLFGASGISPGFGLGGGQTALLNPDGLTFGLLPLLSTGFLPNTLGVLDASGAANPNPQIALSAVPTVLPFLVGLRFTSVGVVASGGGYLTTGPAEWVFR